MAERIDRRRKGRATLIAVDGLDHFFRRAPSQEASAKLSGAPEQEIRYGDGEVAEILIAWMKRV